MPVEPLICTYSPLCGNRRLRQFVEQRLGLFQVGCVEAFGEPAVDRRQQIRCTRTFAAPGPQAGAIAPGAPFGRPRLATPRPLYRLHQAAFALARTPPPTN